MAYMIPLALLLPLFSFLFLFIFGNQLNRKIIHIIGCTAILVSFLIFANHAYTVGLANEAQDILLFPWISLPSLQANITLHIDHLSLLMTLIITGVGFLIHLYSIGYMEGEEDIGRYFACLNFFIFSMLLLVLAGELLLLFVGWEGVGLASYLLIGYSYERPSAAFAATKAFVVNRIGDAAFLLGILLAFVLFKTTDLVLISNQAALLEPHILMLLGALLLSGAIAKSAQAPLHVWLPDAMEGPTPVSALIHAATMVTAGVYLITRLHVLYAASPVLMLAIGTIGGITALGASFAALNQSDLKRVLAYSTVSQLGLMFLACGVGAFYAAMFHLTTHAFMKALLFLSAGNVIHMLHGQTEMAEMGGLSRKLKTTHWLFLIGVLAMSGIPPLAAFFSKDLILEAEYMSGYMFLFYIAVITSILTAIYLTRAYFLTFMGESHPSTASAHEAPKIMLLPASILALLAIVGGFLGFTSESTPFLLQYLASLGITPVERDFTKDFWTSHETWLSIAMAVFSVGFAVLLYTRFKQQLPRPLPILKNAFYFDRIYRIGITIPYTAISVFAAHYLEPHFFGKMMTFFSWSASKLSFGLQKFQSGQIRSYAAWMILGGLCLLSYLTYR